MKWRFGVIGCGHIGKRHAALANRYGKLTAVCDIDKQKLDNHLFEDSAIFYHPDRFFASAHLFDIVIVATPNGFHAEHSIRAMEAGCHVICEKPMALTLADTGLMTETARQTHRHLFVVKQNRFNPPVALLKSLLDTGALGQLRQFQMNGFWHRDASYFQQASWRGTLDLDGGPLFTQFSHFIDLLIWLLGDVAVIDYARGHSYSGISQLRFEDSGEIALTLQNGSSGMFQYSLNTYNKNAEGSLLLLGDKGTVKIGGEYLNRLDYFQVKGVKPAHEITGSSPANQYPGYLGSMNNHHLVYESVIRQLEGQPEMILDLDTSARTVALIEAIYRKMRSV